MGKSTWPISAAPETADSVVSRYRLVIFDLDGTLSDSFPWFLSVVNTVADRHGFARIENEDVETLRAKGSRELIKHLKVSRWKLPRIANDMRKLKSASIGEISLFPGMSDALA